MRGSSYGLYELSEARKPESLGKNSCWNGVDQLFWWHSRWPRSSFWIVDKHGKLLLWSSLFITVLECYKMTMVKPWNIWGWGTSTEDQAVQAGKEEKEDHGKNDLGKNDMEHFTRMQQNLIPFGFCNLFLLVWSHIKVCHSNCYKHLSFFLLISSFFKKKAWLQLIITHQCS